MNNFSTIEQIEKKSSDIKTILNTKKNTEDGFSFWFNGLINNKKLSLNKVYIDIKFLKQISIWKKIIKIDSQKNEIIKTVIKSTNYSEKQAKIEIIEEKIDYEYETSSIEDYHEFLMKKIRKH